MKITSCWRILVTGTLAKHIRRGFSLVPALMLVSFVMLLGLTLAAVLSLELRSASSYKEKVLARRNAVVSARIALGHLQQFAGKDCIATAPATPENGCVVAISAGGKDKKPISLSSCHYFSDTKEAARYGFVEMAPTKETPFHALPAVSVPLISTDEKGAGRFAFWINDESQKIDIGTCETAESTGLPDIQCRRQLCSQRHGVDDVRHVVRADIAHWRMRLAHIESRKEMESAWMAGAGKGENFPLDWRLHTAESLGILANAAEGGLRINWDQKNPLPENCLPCVPATWNAFFRPDISLPAFAGKPAAGLPVIPISANFAERRFPILSGLHVRFGFFNTRADGYHRTRFTCDVQLWNPSPYPLYCTDKARIALLDFEAMPEVEITNLNTAGKISVNMSAFPVGQFGLAKQTTSDTTANGYIDFLDGPISPMPAPGFLAGEVFNFSMPNPIAQPQGLARVLSGTTWKMQTDLNKPTKPPSGANGNNWFHAAHRIEIKGTMPAGGVTLHLREAHGALPGSMQSKDYSKPALTLKNVPWKDFLINLSGQEYNRADSTSYATGEARIAFSLKLKNDSPEKIAEILETLDPREPVLDFADPRVAGLYKIEADVVSGLKVPLATTPKENFLWDAVTNYHNDGAEADPYSEMRSVDRPVARPVSVGSLRHLPVAGKSVGSLNQTYPRNHETDAVWFDRAFFAGAWQDSAVGNNGTRPWSRNPRLVRTDRAAEAGDADIAAYCAVRGSINVNCVEPEVWRDALARVLPEWKRKTLAENNASPETKHPENALFRLPFGAAEPRAVGSAICDFSDDELRTLDTATILRAAGMQGFRSLEEKTRDKLATALSEKIRDRQNDAGAFRSLAEFALSDVLSEAIKSAECNLPQTIGCPLPAYSPLRLNAGDILESLLPVLTTRGDTFTIHAYGGLPPPVSENKISAQARAEIVVQRLPEFFDNSQPAMTKPDELNSENKTFGRRLKIISWHWLDAGEI